MDESKSTKLKGTVERVVYRNPDNDYIIARFKSEESQEMVTIVGQSIDAQPGERLEVKGRWVFNKKYGNQFEIESIEVLVPATVEGIEKYLGSGLIKNVGPKTAHKIVKFFKDQTLQVFEENIDELLKVPGIAEKKLLSIKNSWQEHKSIRDVMIFLQGYGISTLFAVKIFKTYGKEAISKVSTNPYQLARDIYGIGFFSADKIALNMGFEKDGVPRIEAGIKHVLAAARDNGHCYLIESQIIKNTQELLETGTPEQITGILQSLITSNEIKKRVLPDDKGQEVIAYYSNSIFFDEQYVSKRVKQWVAQSIPVGYSIVPSI